MDEIALQTTQLQAHEAVKKIEEENDNKRKEEEEVGKKKQSDQALQQANLDNELIMDEQMNQNDAAINALVKDVIDESELNNNPLPKSVLRLLHYFRSKYL